MSTLAEASGGPDRSDPPGREEVISVIVVVTERPVPLGEIYEEYSAPLRAAGEAFEFLFILGLPPAFNSYPRSQPPYQFSISDNHLNDQVNVQNSKIEHP